MVLSADLRQSETQFADRPPVELETAALDRISTTETPPTKTAGMRGTGRFSSVAAKSTDAAESRTSRLRELGWSVEARDCYRLARLDHRQILLFNDGRIVFKDPTIRGRHQYDREWLNVTAFMWPDVGC